MSAVLLRSSEGTALKAFRLSDVPEHIRVQAALEVAEEVHRSLKERGARQRRPVHREEFFAAAALASSAMGIATNPSDHVYRVSLKAWNEMLDRAEP